MVKDSGTVLIHGKEYQTVASRVAKFRETVGKELSIITELVDRNDQTVVMKASILKGDLVLATGYAEENRTSSTINRTSALENCETSAIGRALAAFGMAGTEYASADEVAQAISRQTPQKTKSGAEPATAKQREFIADRLTKAGFTGEDQAGHLIDFYGVEIPLTKEGAGFVIEQMIGDNNGS